MPTSCLNSSTVHLVYLLVAESYIMLPAVTNHRPMWDAKMRPYRLYRSYMEVVEEYLAPECEEHPHEEHLHEHPHGEHLHEHPHGEHLHEHPHGEHLHEHPNEEHLNGENFSPSILQNLSSHLISHLSSLISSLISHLISHLI